MDAGIESGHDGYGSSWTDHALKASSHGMTDRFTFYEFFAGGGMARAGLGEGWSCAFANDLSPKKAASYSANWGDDDLFVGDVHDVGPAMLRGRADLAWGSFPCQDLSLAGMGAGLSGPHSGAFWGFWSAILALKREGRAPKTLVLENVCGALTSHGGRDFAAIGAALAGAGYRFGAFVINASLFLPQSRPRLFILAVEASRHIPRELISDKPIKWLHPKALISAKEVLSIQSEAAWIWWNASAPCVSVDKLINIIEMSSEQLRWNTASETEKILDLMSPMHRFRLGVLEKSRRLHAGTIYKRMRRGPSGSNVQRAEVRFDGLAGCLRTPAGGSSRQTLIVVEGGRIRTRLISSREAARLMGLDEHYIIPRTYNDAMHLLGDGVAVPVVRFIGREFLEKILMTDVRYMAAE